MKNNSAAFATSTSSVEAGAIPISESQGVQIKTLAPTKSEADHEIKLEGAFIARDLGGFVTKDGRRIKDRPLLRSARLNRLTKNDIQVLTHQYNVGIDFDLRRPQEVAEVLDMATIFDDYDASNDFLRAHNMKRLEALKTAGASRDELELARVDGVVNLSYLHATFDEVKKELGSIDAYLVNGLRISKRQQRKLRKQYLI